MALFKVVIRYLCSRWGDAFKRQKKEVSAGQWASKQARGVDPGQDRIDIGHTVRTSYQSRTRDDKARPENDWTLLDYG